ncbi:MAG TPA: CRTAC1 family protein [Planctomycetaceae bacterium]|nr:CRTAC1 family protein [Planctomycetaceae bacterium]
MVVRGGSSPRRWVRKQWLVIAVAIAGVGTAAVWLGRLGDPLGAGSGSPGRPESSSYPTSTGGLNGQDSVGEVGRPGVPGEGEQKKASPLSAGPVWLTDATDSSGIDFHHTDGSSGRRYIVETVASGVATFDYDGDGLVDVYFVNGAPLADAPGEHGPKNRLYRNQGGFRFVDVTDQAGVGDIGFGLGVAAGDYDNDGDVDLYVSNFGPNRMYRNNGDGTFTEVSRTAGTEAADPTKVGAGVSFLDMDLDGDLDLFVANYLVFSCEHHVTNTWRGVPIYAGPERYPPLAATVYSNEGDGTFVDASLEVGVTRFPGKGMGMVCADYDNDGDTDVFVANDGPPGNFLFRNDGRGRFEEVGTLLGLAFSGMGIVNGSMGADCADVDNDGWLDFYVTSYQRQFATLYRNIEGRMFEDITAFSGAGRRSYNQVTWGCGLVDLDNDGYRDIFFGCGHLLDNIDQLDNTTSYETWPVVLHNTGRGTFRDVSESSGVWRLERSVARGVAFDDLDNDGDLDVVILNSRRRAFILRNDSANQNHWLQVRLVGTHSNRDGVGARVKVVAGGLVQTDEVHAGRGYQSHFGTRLHFGLGEYDHVDRIEVHWPGGGSDLLTDVAADQLVTIVEGRSKPE